MFTRIKTYYQKLIPSIKESDWLLLQERFTIQHLKKGEFLIQNGEVCRHVSFINKGFLRKFYLVDGKEISTGFAPENTYLSQYDSFLTQLPSKGNMDALEDAELINLSYDDMQELYTKVPFLEIFGRKIAEMLFMMVSNQSNNLLTLTPEERYQQVIDKESYIIQRVPQYMIASYIGITAEHLSRLRKKKSLRLV